MAHKFMVGQAVELTPTSLRLAAPGEYEIRHLMPASDGHPQDPSYRVKNIGEKYERVVRQTEISLSKKPEPISS